MACLSTSILSGHSFLVSSLKVIHKELCLFSNRGKEAVSDLMGDFFSAKGM